MLTLIRSPWATPRNPRFPAPQGPAGSAGRTQGESEIGSPIRHFTSIAMLPVFPRNQDILALPVKLLGLSSRHAGVPDFRKYTCAKWDEILRSLRGTFCATNV